MPGVIWLPSAGRRLEGEKVHSIQGSCPACVPDFICIDPSMGRRTVRDLLLLLGIVRSRVVCSAETRQRRHTGQQWEIRRRIWE